MKKILALVLAVVMVLAFASCAKKAEDETTAAAEETTVETAETTEAGEEVDFSTIETMSYEEYEAAAIDAPVVVETYVQAKQSWWEDKATIYCQSEDGAYFVYNMAISEEDYGKLAAGTKIKVCGYKAEWSGEVEIADATCEILDGEYIAEALDVTALLGTDDLIKEQNKFVAFKGLTVEAYDEDGAAFAYKNAEEKTDDLYFKASLDGKTYDFCVEFYLTGSDTDVYKTVEGLKVGDVIDMEGFLYWYEGANPHVTSITVAA